MNVINFRERARVIRGTKATPIEPTLASADDPAAEVIRWISATNRGAYEVIADIAFGTAKRLGDDPDVKAGPCPNLDALRLRYERARAARRLRSMNGGRDK